MEAQLRAPTAGLGAGHGLREPSVKTKRECTSLVQIQREVHLCESRLFQRRNKRKRICSGVTKRRKGSPCVIIIVFCEECPRRRVCFYCLYFTSNTRRQLSQVRRPRCECVPCLARRRRRAATLLRHAPLSAAGHRAGSNMRALPRRHYHHLMKSLSPSLVVLICPLISKLALNEKALNPLEA